MVDSILQLIPNSKKLLAILCIMLAAESIAYYEVHQRHETLIKERDRLIQETIKLIEMKQHKKPTSTKKRRDTMKNSGFTLIETSIVLVVIGLVVGGILVGQNLISTSAQTAQISQIQKYQTAVITFQTKYNGYLPGDIPDPQATQFGFQSRGPQQGEGDGNGIIQSYCPSGAPYTPIGFCQGEGEAAVLWEDLSTAGLIDASIKGCDTMGANYPCINAHPSSPLYSTTTPAIKDYLPAAKLGGNDYVYVYSLYGINYFDVSEVDELSITIGTTTGHTTNAGVTVQQAYNIDSKIDDGLPQSGNVLAAYVNFYGGATYSRLWAAGLNHQGAGQNCVVGYGCQPTTNATAYQPYNCFDNNGIAGTQTYSLSQNANVPNCALSFQFQTQ